ncbi:gustatory receptor for sugar taste 64f-like [Aphidius gifuensis]|uniref:gustatory receptor for sugar taste 64f-like n=1 Tax=Aphidius gifuensis TaxID=684658 RepID=UPI001CDCA910|nr:gustatory receptor for sugar taste 64f-like [Aphidius gifuensis]
MSRILNKNSIDIQPSEAENDSPIFTHHQNLSICKLQSESSIAVSQITLGILIRIAFFFSTFIWNFTDLFIILVSTGLAEKYKCLNKIVIESVVENNDCNIDWPEIREKYTIISDLVKQTNNVISPLILLSFAGNLYFICLQFFKGFAPVDNDVLSEIYFFGSFGFLVCRTAAVTLSAARIHHQSRIILFALFHCPVSSANYEPQWFQNQLAIDEVALTGMDFFSITRKFMLKNDNCIIQIGEKVGPSCAIELIQETFDAASHPVMAEAVFSLEGLGCAWFLGSSGAIELIQETLDAATYPVMAEAVFLLRSLGFGVVCLPV